jgi:hypothetical protein
VKHKHESCSHGPGSPLFRGPQLSRRAFAKLAGTGIIGSWFLPLAAHETRAQQTRALAVPTLNTARNVIFITLTGAPSHIDTFDLKEGPWTPTDFAPSAFGGDVRWPAGLMPKISEQLGRIAIVRSCQAWAAVHDIAEIWAQIARNPTSALGAVAPHLGSVVALELEAGRNPARDILPPFLAFNTRSVANLRGKGYYSSRYAPFHVPSGDSERASVFTHPSGGERFARRWELVKMLDGAARREARFGREATDMDALYDQAHAIIGASDAGAILQFTPDEVSRYATPGDFSAAWGTTFLLAYKALASRRGTRFVHISGLSWDHHGEIYSKQAGAESLYAHTHRFDLAFSALLKDLQNTPGESAGKTLLDETLVVAGGEFGRTVGPLNMTQGRDHHVRHSILFAGGGVIGGRAIGKTDANGVQLVESGWSRNRDVRAEDIAATIYSALGIDYTTVRHDDPLARGFEYVPGARRDEYGPIDSLFAT